MLEQTSEPLLSIGIPTYNRADCLRRCLASLLPCIGSYGQKIELIVSDNASTDETSNVVNDALQGTSPRPHLRYCRQKSNIGVSKNIVYLLQAARGTYFMFLGDDDMLVKAHFDTVVRILSDARAPSAVIQGVWPGKKQASRSGFVDSKEAVKYFYEYGNAYGGIIQRKAAVDTTIKSDLLEKVSDIVWPQTVMGFLAISDQHRRPVYITDFEIGTSLVPATNLPNKLYWLTSFYGLLRAADLIDEFTDHFNMKTSFVSFNNSGFTNHMKAVLAHSLIHNEPTTDKVRALLISRFGLRGKAWSLILYCADRLPGSFLVFVVFIKSLLAQKSPFVVYRQLRLAKTKYENAVHTAEMRKQRASNWF